MNKWVYIALGIFGSIFSLMEFFIADSTHAAYTILTVTCFILAFLYLFDEWRYYREHDALLASLQFILLPILLLLIGNIIAPKGIDGPLLNFTVIIFDNNLEVLSTLTSIVLIFPMIMLFSLFSKYYDKEYPGFVIRRRTFGPIKLPLLIHLLSILSMMIIGFFINQFDIISVIYIFGSMTQITTKLVIPIFQSEGTTRPQQRRRRRPRVSQNQSSQSRTRRVSTSPSDGTRSISTTPSEGYREIPVRSRNERQDRSSSQSRTTRRPKPAAVKADARMIAPSKNVKKVKKGNIAKILPNGNVKQEDLKCIVCYEDFRKSSNGNVVVCPSCKFPAHETEMRSWLNQSNRCPRCGHEIRNSGIFNANKMIPAKQYAKIVDTI